MTIYYNPIEDFGNPCTFTAYARAIISGGQFVFCSGGQNVVNTSGASSYVASDILVAPTASGAQVNGMAMDTVASGGQVSIQTRGFVIVPCNADVLAGYPVEVDGNDAVRPCGSAAANIYHQRMIGRAITSAASGGCAIVNLNL